jgi:CBS domain-containing protein
VRDQSGADVVTRSVRTVTAEATAGEVARLFVANDIGSAIVVDATDATDTLVGIVTGPDSYAGSRPTPTSGRSASDDS